MTGTLDNGRAGVPTGYPGVPPSSLPTRPMSHDPRSDSTMPAVPSCPHLLVLTPAADLYGSDRALLLALPAILEHFDVTLVSAADGPMLAEARRLGATAVVTPDWALRRRGLRLVALPGTAVAVARSLRLLRRIHRRRPVDLVYANTVANALLPLLPSIVPAPLVVHVREVPRDRGRMARVLFGVVDRVADVVLCNSAFTASLVAQLIPGSADRTRVVPDGIEPFDQVGPGGGADGVLDVVCVGRVHPKKGQGVLIEAARLAAERGHRWRLHFWGDALPEHAELAASLQAEVERCGLADRVTWHGYDADTAHLYAGMDVAVVPSVLPEEFSLVTAEGQMAGLPVVATGPGGPSDILVDGETGRIVPPDDPDALAAALIELEDPDRRRQWGRAGRERVLARFTVERYAPAVAAELVTALHPARSGRGA